MVYIGRINFTKLKHKQQKQIRGGFGNFCASKTNNIEKKLSKERPEKHHARSRNNNSFDNKASWHTHTHTCAKTTIEAKRGGGVGRSPLDIMNTHDAS